MKRILSKKVFKNISAFVFALGMFSSLQAYYSEPASYTNPPYTKVVFPGSLSDHTDMLQDAIDLVASNGGGKIYLRKGTYVLNGVNLKSDVHLQFDAKVYLESTGSGTMFGLGGSSSGLVENISFRNPRGKRTTITFHQNAGRFIYCGAVDNVLIRDFNIVDTVYLPVPQISLSWSTTWHLGPKNVRLENLVNSSNSHCRYGYGIVQAHAAKDCEFINMHGRGGVPIRFETGLNAMYDDPIGRADGGVKNARVRNATSVFAQATMKMLPHKMTNGDVDAQTIKSFGSFLTIQFLDSGGGFNNVIFDDIRAYYASSGGQYKWRDLQSLPRSEVESKVTRRIDLNGDSADWSGPSSAVMLGSQSAARGTLTLGSFQALSTSGGNCAGSFVNPAILWDHEEGITWGLTKHRIAWLNDNVPLVDFELPNCSAPW